MPEGKGLGYFKLAILMATGLLYEPHSAFSQSAFVSASSSLETPCCNCQRFVATHRVVQACRGSNAIAQLFLLQVSKTLREEL